ncbi:hypothetical protein MMC20_007719 [Loxospora ochrophaea]|nr:hypothetical protein [Loxospora ochrophaea]
MNPYTATREQFTRQLTDAPLPDHDTVSPEWTRLATSLRNCLKKLAYHPAMEPNLQQTYMTPANSKNSVYFMWDFVGRTLGNLYQVDPTLKDLSRQEKEQWNDAVGRTVLAQELLLDTKPGALNTMTESTYPSQRGNHPELGEDVLVAARQLGKDP